MQRCRRRAVKVTGDAQFWDAFGVTSLGPEWKRSPVTVSKCGLQGMGRTLAEANSQDTRRTDPRLLLCLPYPRVPTNHNRGTRLSLPVRSSSSVRPWRCVYPPCHEVPDVGSLPPKARKRPKSRGVIDLPPQSYYFSLTVHTFQKKRNANLPINHRMTWSWKEQLCTNFTRQWCTRVTCKFSITVTNHYSMDSTSFYSSPRKITQQHVLYHTFCCMQFVPSIWL